MSFSSTIITQINSPVSYTDLVGLYLGMTRFVGESNTAFLQRMYKAAANKKDTSVQGLIDNICFNLGLDVYKAIEIASPVNTVISLSPGVLKINDTTIPLFRLSQDTYLEWLQLSEVVSLINNIPDFTASLLIEDGPALKLSKQSNVSINLNEAVITTSNTYTIQNKDLIGSSIIFNIVPPSYTVVDNTLTFTKQPSADLTISYQSTANPFALFASDVSLVSLTDKTLISEATSEQNVLGYQLREAIQEIMKTDRSYWTV